MNKEEKEDVFLKSKIKNNNNDVPKEIDDVIELTLNSLEKKNFSNKVNGEIDHKSK